MSIHASTFNAGSRRRLPAFLVSAAACGLGFAAGSALVSAAPVGAASASATPAAAATSSAAGYRLAGVLDSGPNNRIGFLQLPRGGQVMIRQGSVIDGGGRIVEFSQRAVRIAFPDGRVVQIDLSGAGGGAAAVAAVAAAAPVNQALGSHPVETDPIVTRTDDHGNTLVRHIELRRFAKALEQQASQAGSASSDVTQRLRDLLKLPVDSRIVALNDTPVGSAPGTIKKIQSLLSRNVIAALNLESPSGMQRVYLMPDDPRQP